MNFEIKTKLISMENMIESGCFDFDKAISIIEQALVDYKNGNIILPDKISQIFSEQTQDRINCMPATLIKENICGMKWVSVFPNNPQKLGIPNVSGIIVLSSTLNGHPVAIMDGTFITALRTACIGAIAAKNLAKKDSKVYATIGSGEQAKMHFMAIKSQIPSIKICKVASLDYKNEMQFINEMKKKYNDVEFISFDGNTDDVAKEADIIVTAVSCQKPLLKADSIKQGAFYCHVGGWEDEYEVPLKANKIVCDMWESVKHRTQTISRLYKQGRLRDEDIYADIVDIVDGTLAGRENDKEFIYFNSVGLAYIDVSIAYDFYKRIPKEKAISWCLQENSIFDNLNKQE